MEDKFSPEVSPKGIKVKRLNRKPLFITLLLGMCILIAYTYLIAQSGKRQKKVLEQTTPPYIADKTAAESLLSGQPKHGAIPLEQEPIQEIQATPSQPRQKEPGETKTSEPTLEQKELERIRQAKMKRFEQALLAPSSVGKSGLNLGNSKGLVSSAQAASFAGTESPFEKMMESRAAQDPFKEEDPNNQARKEEFFLQDQPATEYLPYTRNKQRSPLEIKTGTVIPATMLGGLNSDLPGMILAQVSQNVYDTATGDFLLVPQGARLVGTYDNYIAYGQNRALVAWNRLIYPDGSTLELKGMPGTDQAGFAGLEDQVDNHYFRIFGSALLMSVITGAYDYSQGNTVGIGEERSAGDTMASAVARELAQTSQMLLQKNLSIQPTIKIRPGYKLNVMVNRDIIFPSVW